MLDLEERLTRHYADVATAPSLHRSNSNAPRIAFAGLVLAVIAGAVYLVGPGSSGENVIATPDPDAGIDTSSIDPELIRLLELVPFDPDGMSVSYNSFGTARRDTDLLLPPEELNGIIYPRALELGPSLSSEMVSAVNFPDLYERTFGYGFNDVEQTLAWRPASSLGSNVVVLGGAASDALDRATAPPSRVEETTRTQDGAFDILDWGDDFQISDRSDVRPLGEAGQLTAFDESVVLSTRDRASLDQVLAADRGAPSLVDQAQFMGGLVLLDQDDSLGFTAHLQPSGLIGGDDIDEIGFPTLRIIETSIDGSHRVVLGFLPGTDIDRVEAGLRRLLPQTIDVASGAGSEAKVLTTAISQSDRFVLIDFTPEGIDLTATNLDLEVLVVEVFSENPEIIDIDIGTGTDTDEETGAIDPELLRLLERAPYESGTDELITYLDLEVARRGQMTEVTGADGISHSSPDALSWAPSAPFDVTQAFRYPTAYEATFGYPVEDIERSLTVGSQGLFFSTSFLVIDGDASAALDRATAPAWATQDIRTREGSFDVRDWGDAQSQTDSTDVRTLGQAGQMTAFDGNVLLQTPNRGLLDPVLATDGETTTLTDQAQLIAALEVLDSADSLGFSALLSPSGQQTTPQDNVEYRVPTVHIVETSLDGSSRVVMGFGSGVDVDATEVGIRSALGSSLDLPEAGDPELTVQVTVGRVGDLIVIDVDPEPGDDLIRSHEGLLIFMIAFFSENPEILS